MNNERRFSGLEIFLLILIVLISIGSLIIYAIQMHESKLSKDPSDFGTFGDYIGGVLGSLISLISISLLYRTYKTQLDITKVQEERSYIQQFENTLFELLSNQRTILTTSKGTFYDRKDISTKGIILCDHQFIDKVAEELKIQMLDFEYDHSLLKQENINLIRIIINDHYSEVFTKHTTQLGHYFRHLYHILKYIDTSEISNKKKYVDLVQAQMSNNELYISFYNGISIYGRKKMLPLMDKYSFLENLKDNDFTTKSHQELFYRNTKFKSYMDIKSNIIFVGGIHGVGKGYICSELTKSYNIRHLVSSEVLQWDKGNEKRVKDVDLTQNILLENLKKIISPDEKYLLDGHFCLLNIDNTIQDIPFNTFREINPIFIILITDELLQIKERLDKRDNKIYDIELLDKFQKREIKYAKTIADELGIECIEISPNNLESIKPVMDRIMNE